MKLTVGHLYPQEMNIYGDMGNIITLKNRTLWRNIDFELININKGKLDKLPAADIYFMGGGQDNDMFKVFDDLIENKKEFILKEVENNKVFLLICGAFQLFGKYFLDADGRRIEGINAIQIETKAPSNVLEDRCLGNLVTELQPAVLEDIERFYPNNYEKTSVGFENHSGQTYFMNDDIKNTGNVLYGKGNNAKEKKEGARFKNIFGSYTHGSMLPKNPHIADMLIGLALSNKYGDEVKLRPLDDSIEWQAHKKIRSKLVNF